MITRAWDGRACARACGKSGRVARGGQGRGHHSAEGRRQPCPPHLDGIQQLLRRARCLQDGLRCAPAVPPASIIVNLSSCSVRPRHLTTADAACSSSSHDSTHRPLRPQRRQAFRAVHPGARLLHGRLGVILMRPWASLTEIHLHRRLGAPDQAAQRGTLQRLGLPAPPARQRSAAATPRTHARALITNYTRMSGQLGPHLSALVGIRRPAGRPPDPVCQRPGAG